ncbi:MAG: hypothetical protein KIT15_02385 [Xanthobacteraceae bacterium]|nr:hypothetical protein [Xanthobacteraceae bacterium]
MPKDTSVVLAEERKGKDSRYISLSVQSNGAIRVYGSDIGPIAESAWGRDEYEFWLDIEKDAITKLAFELLREKLQGNLSAVADLKTFCEHRGIATEFNSW